MAPEELWDEETKSQAASLSPGPRGFPILGAILDVPSLSDKPWLVYDKWFKKYGESALYEAFAILD